MKQASRTPRFEPSGPKMTERLYYTDAYLRDFDATLRETGEFFMDGGDVRKTMVRLAERLSAEGISYAVVGGMALGKHGYVRTAVIGAVLHAFSLQVAGTGSTATGADERETR